MLPSLHNAPSVLIDLDFVQMSRSSVRQLFLIAFVVLIVQYGLVGLIGVYASEPWPAVVLPAFKSVYATDNAFTVEKARIEVTFADETAVTIPTPQFLRPLPRSHHPSFLSTQCRPSSLSGTTDTESCLTSDGSQWFTHRAHTQFPDRSIKSVDVIWQRLQFDARKKQRSATPLDTLTLSAALQ